MPEERKDAAGRRGIAAQDRADEAQAHADRAQERAERAEARAERAEGRAQEHSAMNRRQDARPIDAHGQMEQQMLGEMLVQAEMEEAAEKQAHKERVMQEEQNQVKTLQRNAEAEYTGQCGLARSDRNWTQTPPLQRSYDVSSRARHADMAASKAALSASKAYTAHRELSRLVEQGCFTNPYAKLPPEAVEDVGASET